MRFNYAGNWTINTLDEICDFYKGNGLSKSDLSSEGRPCILYGELYTSYKKEIIDSIISKTDTMLSKPFISKKNDVIIPGSGEDPIDIAVARAIENDGIILGGDLNVLRLPPKYSGAFLSYQLNGKRRYEIAKKAQGKSIVHLHNSDLKDIKVFMPQYDEQLKIINLLKHIDKRIELQNKIIEGMDSLKQSISIKLFDQLESAVKLCDVCSITKGKQINGSELLEKGQYYMMNGGTEPSGYLNDFNTIEGTISISEGGNSCGYVQYNKEKFWSGGHCYTLKNLSNLIDTKYLYFFLKAKEKDVMALRIGTGLPNIQKKDIESFLIPVPNMEFQNDIVKVLESISLKIDVLKRQLEYYKQQKQYLLSNLFI